MVYYLFKYIDKVFDLPGTGVFKYISFRAAAAALCSLLITILLGKSFIPFLQQKQINEGIRKLDLAGEEQKKKIPTMGGIIIITATIVPTLLWAKLNNIYIILLVITTLWMGLIGFLDDYIKVFKKNKQGLAAKLKILGQVALGLVVSLTLYFHPEVVIRTYAPLDTLPASIAEETLAFQDIKSTRTNVPFFKKNELDYSKIIPFLEERYTWIVYVLAIICIIISVSNAANLTDGLDGLLAGISAINSLTLAILAYVSGNFIFAHYLHILHIPHLGEVSIFCTAFVGACLGFLWYNAYPAQIFMGDTGSLTIGAIIAVLAIIMRKELLIPLLCGIFLLENLSVMIQIGFFKYTKKKYGVGRRIFKMAPIHHHYQKLGWHESKTVARFWIISILLAVLTLMTLKLR